MPQRQVPYIFFHLWKAGENKTENHKSNNHDCGRMATREKEGERKERGKGVKRKSNTGCEYDQVHYMHIWKNHDKTPYYV